MGRNIAFSENAFEEYLYWQKQDRKTLDRINRLIQDIQRNGPSYGIGKPEALRHVPGWSRRIDEYNRLVYQELSDILLITSCKGHYDHD